ncbi:MAG: Tfp pilus assembly protein, major type IV pilin class A [Berkelbacteria bacterium GW2011_GWE1_39_12]|uniref:Tfp pilus assembly protein, major type IV pilin class A n=1 Tax=Berkelbacteria bacterium GW2011_GWE1_39_12 TaxID=1618337 RepID=A0A0G4B3C3_9BACT|nr:MAG: Tfp pilus assembly protein, major type IV pilin class A [Berkelbacteria bacterium GW2011_GWE1_39_12]
MRKKGFTLIELLIVVAIIAILAIIVVVAINPAKMLSKARDSQRFSDTTSIATAVNLYLADNNDFTGLVGPYLSTVGSTDNARKKNDATGWIPINFTAISSGAPLAALPLDPTNTATYHYTFGVSTINKTYEIDCAFEHSDNTPKHSADGGNNSDAYEVGTDLTILP